MRDDDCVALLTWLLPRLGLRWAGFRAVRRQVCKRISRRLAELGLTEAHEYRAYLGSHPEEWAVVDSFCTVTISTFNRDAEMFAFLARSVLPELAAHAIEAGDSDLKAWSVGCASGEEPYTLVLLWDFLLAERFPTLTLRILGTDIDRRLLERAESACYPSSAVKHLPSEWLARAFEAERGTHCLKPAYKNRVAFEWHDMRRGPINGPFDLITCRNVAFTYFELVQQRAAAEILHGRLRAGGALVLGRGEKLPPDAHGFSVWSGKHVVYRKELE